MDIVKILQDILGYRKVLIREWFTDKFSKFPAVLTSSVDVRCAKYKVAPIDTNFFPAGYNNLGESGKRKAETFLLKRLSQYTNGKVLIIIEGHTRNKKYIDSVIVLRDMLCNVGFDTEVGGCDLLENLVVESSKNGALNVQKLVNNSGKISTETGFTPDVIILNNDLTSGIPAVLKGDLLQDVMPSRYLGWFNRRKSGYFDIYARIAEEFCNEFDIDPWLITALFSHCDNVDFVKGEGIERIASGVEDLLSKIREKFVLYNISEPPYVFIKADNGTYGMGIVSVCSGEDVLKLNKKDRNKMRCVKERNPIRSVILQEGIPTNEMFGNHVAEPILYYIGEDLACYLCRYNGARSCFENLNVPGCGFADMEFSVPQEKKCILDVVGKLAILASAMEGAEILRHASNTLNHE
ncbi:Glutamate-cysteine ligase [Anaplasma phagocytophilum]|uniref:Glutamate-cysteine ligase n=1 Tax=Anaplasma phagocytophilum TaxID=948 RepID=A0AA45UTS0_ANAPH|nr:glutamate--cysteine ligase [Anaplasma phagocytophilum]SBO14734.1 Glutamate-cysteine ligase [Anaplasma phagocytophilum]